MAPDYQSLFSYRNLELAWRRITTAVNLSYKRYYRPLIAAYEVGLKGNLKYLQARLRGGWTPLPPRKVFLPKPSGLQRPISVLAMEDLIVYQAAANIIAKKVGDRRRRIQDRWAFSHCLNHDANSIFFLDRWQESYRRFQNHLERSYLSGREYVAHFDFAAFYDTISHEVLLKTIAPRSQNDEPWRSIRRWLKTWSSQSGVVPLEQGLPQGPNASDFLAEVFLMPLDEAMGRDGTHYFRYGDDIRVLAKTRTEALRAAIKLEIHAKHLGLIPQSKKYGIARASSLEEAMGSLPSIRLDSGDDALLPEDRAYAMFRQAVGRGPVGITDKSRARHVLFHSPPSRRLLAKALKLLPRHPEHIDAFCVFFSRFSKSRPLERTIVDLLRGEMPYAFVRGELWHILADLASDKTRRRLIPRARDDLKRFPDALSLLWGAMHFLLHCQKQGLCKAARNLQRLDPLAQALLISDLPDDAYTMQSFISGLLTGDAFEPGIVLAAEFVSRRLSHRDFAVHARSLPAQVQNTFRGSGLIRGVSIAQHDQIGAILATRFAIPRWTKWRGLLGQDYGHALEILLPGDALFDVSPSAWIQHQDSFNDLLFHGLQTQLRRLRLPGAISTLACTGKRIQYGSLLDPKNAFCHAYPALASELREFHERRNRVPSSHPYDLKTGARTAYLRNREKGAYRFRMIQAYGRIIALLDPHL